MVPAPASSKTITSYNFDLLAMPIVKHYYAMFQRFTWMSNSMIRTK
jgi:hypothetical protein